jgi:hypothetical protein
MFAAFFAQRVLINYSRCRYYDNDKYRETTTLQGEFACRLFARQAVRVLNRFVNVEQFLPYLIHL